MFPLRRAALQALAKLQSSQALKSRVSAPSLSTPLQRRYPPWISLSCQLRFASEATTPKRDETAPIVEEITKEDTAAITPSNTGAGAVEPELQKGQSGSETVSDVTSSSHTPEDAARRVVYIGNLFFDVTEDQLREKFAPHGEVQSINLVKDIRGLPKGFGFITFKDPASAESALTHHQEVFEGRRIVVQPQTPRAQRSLNQRMPIGLRNPNPPSRTLFIGNMSFEMSDKDLNELFREIENVIDVRVAVDRHSGSPRGFAHADFVDVESAKVAYEKLRGKEVYGRMLRVDYSSSSRYRDAQPQTSAGE